MNIFTSEQVSWGHPDKICDRISDAILTECIKNDENSRCAIETMIKDYEVYVVGEVTTSYNLYDNHAGIIRDVLNSTYLDGDRYNIHYNITEQSPDIALGTNDTIGGAGDQGMMFGYATNETSEMLPIPYVLATKALQIMKQGIDKKVSDYEILRADAKAQVTWDYENNRIDTFLISSQHVKEASLEEVRMVLSSVMKGVAEMYNCNTDFRVLVNPTGRFVVGSSFADSGLTGRKIIADTYGGMCRHGGGAFSGKDPTKVDRSGAYIARKIAKDVVKNFSVDKCEVQLAYAIGVADPVSIAVNTFDSSSRTETYLSDWVRSHYDLTPKGIIKSLELKSVDYNLTSSYGHFTDKRLPWEV